MWKCANHVNVTKKKKINCIKNEASEDEKMWSWKQNKSVTFSWINPLFVSIKSKMPSDYNKIKIKIDLYDCVCQTSQMETAVNATAKWLTLVQLSLFISFYYFGTVHWLESMYQMYKKFMFPVSNPFRCIENKECKQNRAKWHVFSFDGNRHFQYRFFSSSSVCYRI